MQSNNKKLIVYFSLSGTTKKAAEKIETATGADIVQLEPKKAYPAGYENYTEVAKRQLDNDLHPAISTEIKNWAQYGTVFVGFPTWWQQPPMIIHSLFEQFDFTAKTVVPFTTSMSTPIDDSMAYFRDLVSSSNAKLVAGFRYNNDDQALANFLQANGLV
ncbi:flavodoxin [Loigolactobacillus iwatensis]|uniref:flavodoxin n=1 Tax=Loigolactobacillus iwatensis TaxID=1267156 RepID=UPI000F7ECE95|nr:flavodoxin [Loigolactobacillus iwatensis]